MIEGNFTQSEDSDKPDFFKIVLLGDAGVGKTHLINMYVRKQAPQTNVPTIGTYIINIPPGIEFASKTVTLSDGGKVKTQIWDTVAGQERYRGITSNHFRKADGALLVYDITKEKTFESLAKWIDDLKSQASDHVIIFLVGNKLDLVEKTPTLRQVSQQKLHELANKNQAMFDETSAIKGTNVNTCFDQLIERIYQHNITIAEIYFQKNKYSLTNNEDNSQKIKQTPPNNECQCSC